MQNLKPLEANIKRQAVPSLRGYSYQIWHSLFSWIKLEENELLFLEGAEDIDILDPQDISETIQVKETAKSGSVTLRTKDVLESINNYWKIKLDNKNRKIKFRFLTTSERGKENPNPFNNLKGLDLWDLCKEEKQNSKSLRSFLKKQKDYFSTELYEFLKNSTDEELRENLFIPIDWDTGNDSQVEIEKLVLEKLISFGNSQGFLHSEYEAAINSLLRYVWEVVLREENRRLERNDFLREFEKATTESISKSELRKLRNDSATLEKNRTAPFQLSASLIDFTGRKAEIEKISSQLATATNQKVNIYGMGGVGKTELALLIANKISDKFPDGQIFIDFHGTDKNPLKPVDSLTEIIRSIIGIQEKIIPDINVLKNQYQTILHGKQVLLLFDNVADREQISNLNPPLGCALLVTSRSKIAGLNNTNLDVLDSEEAVELIQKIVPEIDLASANTICELCGFLPLAIRAAGSLLEVTEDLDPKDYAIELHEEKTRLEKLGEEGVAVSVKTVFNSAYNRLPKETGNVFKSLSVFTSDFSSDAEEFICNDLNHTHLSKLLRYSLVSFDKRSRRYRLHELVRIFATSLCNDEEKLETRKRFASFYSDLLEQISNLYLQTGIAHQQGLETFALEVENFKKGWEFLITKAEIDTTFANSCLEYLSAGKNLLLNQLAKADLVEWCEKAILIARKYNHPPAEVTPLWFLGLIYERSGEYSLSVNAFQKALKIVEGLDSLENVAYFLSHLGRVLNQQGKPHESIQLLKKAKQILCDLGKHEKEGKIISEIAFAQRRLNNTHQEFSNLKLVLDNNRKYNNKEEIAHVLGNLANYFGKKSKPLAIICSEQAADIYYKLGYRHWEAISISQAGLFQTEMGNSERGIAQIQYAIKLHQEIDDKRGETTSTGKLAEAYREIKEYDKALATFDEQINLARKTNNFESESSAIGNKAIILNKLSRFEESVKLSNEALEIVHSTGNYHEEFIGLCHLGEAYAKFDNRNAAIATFERQVKVAETMQTGKDVLHAYKHLADLLEDWGDLQKSIEYMQKAVEFCKSSQDGHDYPESAYQLSKFFAKQGNYEKAIAQAEIAQEYFEKISDFSCVERVKFRIGVWRKPPNS